MLSQLSYVPVEVGGNLPQEGRNGSLAPWRAWPEFRAGRSQSGVSRMNTLGVHTMKSTALATILSTLSLVGVAMLYFEVVDLSESVQTLSRARGGDPVQVDTPLRAERRDRGVRARPDEGERTPERNVPAGDTGEDARAPVGTVEDRIARLEAAEKKRASRAQPTRGWRRPSYARNVDDLAKRLKLTPAQKDRVKSVVDRAKQQIQDVMKIPDADGKSPAERRVEQRKKMREAIEKKDASGVFSFAHNPFGYRNKPIPGQNATYGQEIDRIKKEARDEIGSTLSKEQKETFDDMKIDPVLGEGGGHFTSIAFAGPMDGDALVVETAVGSADIELVEPEQTEKKPSSKDD